MQAKLSVFAALMAALALSACNQGSPIASVPPQPQQQPQVAPEAAFLANLPPSGPCSEKIRRYQSVLVADEETGNLERRVYDEIEQELIEAAKACTAGHGREAIGLVHASQERHGYHG